MNARQHSCMNARMQIIPSAKALFRDRFSPLSSDEIFGPLNFRTSFFQLLDFADRKGVLFLVFLKGFPYSDSCTFHICSIIIIWDLKGGVLRTGYCLSQTNKKTDDFFICSLTTWICSSVNCLFKPFPIGLSFCSQFVEIAAPPLELSSGPTRKAPAWALTIRTWRRF